MDPMISFRCPACDRTLKVRADKAGRRARCKCGAEVVIPRAVPEASSIPLSEAPAPRAQAGEVGTIPLSPDKPSPSTPRLAVDDGPAAPPPAPGPAAPPANDEDEEEGTYGLIEGFEKPAEEEKPKRRPPAKGEEDEEEPDEEDEEKAAKEKEEEDEAMRQRRKRLAGQRRGPTDPEPWQHVQKGLVFLAVAIGLWAGGFFLHQLFVFVGGMLPSQYAYVASHELVFADDPPVVDRGRRLDRTDFMLGLISGSDFFTMGKVLVFLALALVLAQLAMVAVGALVCLKVPKEFGARLQAQALIALAGVNFVILLVFQLLPLTGLIRYTMIPFLTPEVAMLEANTDRVDPIHVSWSGAPIVEIFFALLFWLALLAQPVLIASFLRAVARSLKMESLEQTATGLIRLGAGTAFAWMAYLLLMGSGTSDVLLLVLRAVYLFTTVFFLGELIWLTLVLLRSRVGIEKVLKVGWVA
jgi:hypothetical protein